MDVSSIELLINQKINFLDEIDLNILYNYSKEQSFYYLEPKFEYQINLIKFVQEYIETEANSMNDQLFSYFKVKIL